MNMIGRVKASLLETDTDITMFDDRVIEEIAIAAIEAMATPTREMHLAGAAANVGPRSTSHGYIYKAMIDAAIKGR